MKAGKGSYEWMNEQEQHEQIKDELQKFLSENEHILNLVGEENVSALLLVAKHFATWQKTQTRDEHFWNGMQHAKEELMKDAMEGKIIFLLNGDVAINIGDMDKYNLGDKVRIIILKQEDGK